MLAVLHWKGIIEVPRIDPCNQFRREEEIFHVLQRFKTGLPRVENRKLALVIERESRKGRTTD